MALKTVLLKRKFIVKRNGKPIEIDDPNPDWNLLEVQKFLAMTYPEIVNMTVPGPEIKHDYQIYTFDSSKAISTLG